MKTRIDENVRATIQVPEAARILGSGNHAVRDLLDIPVEDGGIPHIRAGRKILIPRTAFHRWLDSCGQAKLQQRSS